MKFLRGSGSFAMEQLQKLVNNVFATLVLMVVVLVLTILAVTYQPPDPLFLPQAMDKVFTSIRNATFQTDDMVLVTGEDSLASSPLAAVQVEVTGPGLNTTGLNNPLVSNGTCDPEATRINCTDPGVLVAIELANLKKFPDMGSFEYGAPAQGSEDSKCDVAWRFKPRSERSGRTYRDFRWYKLLVNSSCDYVVENIGGWHSGKNARFGKEVVNDSLVNRSANTFWNNRYLYYSRGGDHCKSMSQYLWSFLCALGEAQYLNRTLVVDLEVCLSGKDNPGHADEEGKDFRFYFDYEHLQNGAAVVDQRQFLKRWQSWNKKHPRNTLQFRVVNEFNVTPMHLAGDESTILWRKFDKPEPENYWYRVCEGEPEKVIQRPWQLVWKSKRLMNIVNAICAKLGWDFDAVHVVRGKKAENKEVWPNLDSDTSPEAILEKLEKQVEEGRNVYIATNEMLEGYFDKLRARYRVFMLSDFKTLWGKNSLWYNETMLLTGNKPVEFDGYMKAEIDSEVFLRAKKRVETFGQLTRDCKDGVNTC